MHILSVPVPVDSGCFIALGIGVAIAAVTFASHLFPAIGEWLGTWAGFFVTMTLTWFGWRLGRHLHSSVYLPEERRKQRRHVAAWAGDISRLSQLRAAVNGLNASRQIELW
jgi:hypothetical protein